MADERMSPAELQQRRSKARRTAVVLIVIAAGIYAAFILSGVFGTRG